MDIFNHSSVSGVVMIVPVMGPIYCSGYGSYLKNKFLKGCCRASIIWRILALVDVYCVERSIINLSS
jgi:hypothetical protein